MTVLTELVDYTRGTVLAKKFVPCHRHGSGQEAVNNVSERELQDQAVLYYEQHPEEFPRCSKCFKELHVGEEHECPDKDARAQAYAKAARGGEKPANAMSKSKKKFKAHTGEPSPE